MSLSAVRRVLPDRHTSAQVVPALHRLNTPASEGVTLISPAPDEVESAPSEGRVQHFYKFEVRPIGGVELVDSLV